LPDSIPSQESNETVFLKRIVEPWRKIHKDEKKAIGAGTNRCIGGASNSKYLSIGIAQVTVVES
jgi:hypothetical protein